MKKIVFGFHGSAASGTFSPKSLRTLVACWMAGTSMAWACYLSAPRLCPSRVTIQGVPCTVIPGYDFFLWYIAAPAGSWGFTQLINDNYQWCRYTCDDGQERSAYTGVHVGGSLCRGTAHHP